MRWLPKTRPPEPTGEIGVPEAPSPMFGNGLHLIVSPDDYPRYLERLRDPASPDAGAEFLVDWAGIRTRIPMLPWSPQEFAGTTSTALPIPTDGYRSEAEEYVGLALSLVSDRDAYRVIEVGAGWGPWAVMGVRCAQRMGKRATGIAVEADPTKAAWARQHAIDNGVADDVTVIDAACWHTSTTLRFPLVEPHDMGGAVNTGTGTMDNRGAHFDHIEVPAITLEELLDVDEPTDLLHIDLQGMELEVIVPALELIERKVRFLAVGTHNRYVEGVLQHTLLPREWALLMESPSTAIFDGVKPTLTGFTVQDGNQFYANSRFRDADPGIIRPGHTP